MKTETETISIAISVVINAPVEKVWSCFTEPNHIMRWNNASDDWHTTNAENDLSVGGRFLSRMEARDGSVGFDFSGKYHTVELHESIGYTLDDNRNVYVEFVAHGNDTIINEVFDAEHVNSIELQEAGWQAILNNFKKYVETHVSKVTLHFEIEINAAVENVFRNMLDEKFWNEWTSAFNPESTYKGSWEKGSKILFYGVSENGEVGGMVSRIKEYIPNKFVSIEHYGLINGDEEITSGPEVEIWAGAMENYYFSENNGFTTLKVDLDSNNEFMSYFEDTWPKALAKLKEICER